MRSKIAALITVLVLCVASTISFFWDAPVVLLEGFLGTNRYLGAGVFTLLMFLSTVLAPITTLPLVPLVAPILGPFVTALLTIFGWTAGAVVAFLIARHAGRPFLGKIVALDELEKYEAYIPPHARFMFIVSLRLIMPVDVLSYALGFFSSVSLPLYTVATALGISWFAFAFAYLGDAAFSSNLQLFGVVVLVSLTIFGLALRYVLQQVRRKNDI